MTSTEASGGGGFRCSAAKQHQLLNLYDFWQLKNTFFTGKFSTSSQASNDAAQEPLEDLFHKKLFQNTFKHSVRPTAESNPIRFNQTQSDSIRLNQTQSDSIRFIDTPSYSPRLSQTQVDSIRINQTLENSIRVN